MAEPRVPFRAFAEVQPLDDDEVREGYRDGRANEPEPGDNRSLAYWHGWRVGMADGGHRELDDADADLAGSWVDETRQRRLAKMRRDEQ